MDRNLKNSAVALTTFSILTLLYSSRFLFSDGAIGEEFSDFYSNYAMIHVYETVLAEKGLPIGRFWIPDLHGGTPSIPLWSILNPVAAIIYLSTEITGNYWLAVKILVMACIFASQFLMFKYANFFFKNLSLSILASTIYAFSQSFSVETRAGHISILVAMVLFPAIALIFEKTSRNPTRCNIALTSIGLTIMVTVDGQIALLLAVYLTVKALWDFFHGNRNSLKTLLLSAIPPVIIVIYTVLEIFSVFGPESFTTPYRYLYGMESFIVLFDRNSAFYLGATVIGLSLIPLASRKFTATGEQQPVRFYWLTAGIFALFSMNIIPLLITKVVLLPIIRVPYRALFLVSFSFALLSCYGITPLFKRISFNKGVILSVVLVALIFFDVAFPVLPSSQPVSILSSNLTKIKEDTAQYRILKYPIKWAVSNYESAMIDHEIIGQSPFSIRDYPSYYSEGEVLYNQFVNIYNINDTSQFMLAATLYGVKYMVVDKTDDYQGRMIVEKLLNLTYVTLINHEGGSYLFRNSLFRGMAIPIKLDAYFKIFINENLTLQEFQAIALSTPVNATYGFNKITLTLRTNEPVVIVVSHPRLQGFKLYSSKLGDEPLYFTRLNLMAFTVDAAGDHNFTLTYASWEPSIYTELCITTLWATIILFYIRLHPKTLSYLKITPKTYPILLLLGCILLLQINYPMQPTDLAILTFFTIIGFYYPARMIIEYIERIYDKLEKKA